MQKAIQFEMHPDERDLILRHSIPSTELERRLRLGIHAASGLLFSLPPELFVELVDCVAAGADAVRRREEKRQLREIHERLTALETIDVDALREESDDKAALLESMPPHLREAITNVIEDPRFETMDQVNAALQAVMQMHNQTPIAQFAGLSPEQLMRLLTSDWDDPEAAFYVRHDLTLADVEHTQAFKNARAMIAALGRDGTRATSGGNFNPKFVAQMSRELDYPHKEMLLEINKRTYEDSFLVVQDLRYLLMYARLIRKQRGLFKRTRVAEKLLHDERAGELYVLLFLTMFRHFDLGHPWYDESFGSLQAALPFAVCGLRRYATEWCDREELAPAILLPAAIPPGALDDHWCRPDWMADRFVLRPLEQFGLIESQPEEMVRITPLFHRVFQIRL